MRPGEGNGSCGMCRAETCRAKTCRAAQLFDSMDVSVHDKPGLRPTVFSFYDDAFSFFFPPHDFRKKKKKRGALYLVRPCYGKNKSCNVYSAAFSDFRFPGKKHTK